MTHHELIGRCLQPGGVEAYLILSGDKIAKLAASKFVPKYRGGEVAELRVEFAPYVAEENCSLLAKRLVVGGSASTITSSRRKLQKGEVVDFVGTVNIF